MLKCSSASFIDSTVDRLFSLEHDAHIWILDRDVATLTLHWVQPERCHDAEQCWRLGFSIKAPNFRTKSTTTP
jgi:hypothetical protein